MLFLFVILVVHTKSARCINFNFNFTEFTARDAQEGGQRNVCIINAHFTLKCTHMHTYECTQHTHTHAGAQNMHCLHRHYTEEGGKQNGDVALSKDLRLIVAWWIQFTCLLQSQPVKLHVWVGIWMHACMCVCVMRACKYAMANWLANSLHTVNKILILSRKFSQVFFS